MKNLSQFQEIFDSSSKQLNIAKHIFATIKVGSSEVERGFSVAQMTGRSMVAERKCFEIFRQITWFVIEVLHAPDCSISTQSKPRAQPFIRSIYFPPWRTLWFLRPFRCIQYMPKSCINSEEFSSSF